ncbi:MAG: hypothetical protein FWC82_02830 [Firmicutes bacterium]|nr:hypothetical protein [Bacillota bacterium]
MSKKPQKRYSYWHGRRIANKNIRPNPSESKEESDDEKRRRTRLRNRNILIVLIWVLVSALAIAGGVLLALGIYMAGWIILGVCCIFGVLVGFFMHGVAPS